MSTWAAVILLFMKPLIIVSLRVWLFSGRHFLSQQIVTQLSEEFYVYEFIDGMHIQRHLSPAVCLWVSLRFMQACVVVWVCLHVCGRPAGPFGGPEAPAERKTAWKEKIEGFFRISRYIGSGAMGSISGTALGRSGTWNPPLKAKEINAFHS